MVDRPLRRLLGGLGLPAALKAAYNEAVLAIRLEVREQFRDRLPHDASAVDGDAMIRAQDESRVLEAEQLVRRHVDGDLLVVTSAPRTSRPPSRFGVHRARRGVDVCGVLRARWHAGHRA